MAMLLGFLDDIITEPYASQVNYTTNKLGGHPDYLTGTNIQRKVVCKMCGSVIPLLLQVYAPITERPRHHRNLYIFACINPGCWGNSKSWTCVKQQTIVEQEGNCESFSSTNDWGTDADNWDLDDHSNSSTSASLINEVTSMVEQVSVFEENANEVSPYGTTDLKNLVATAEIEPDENEPITLDSPVSVNCDLMKMMKQKPPSCKTLNDNAHFIPAFICVGDEKLEKDPLSERVQLLLSDYSRQGGNINDLKITKNVNVRPRSDENYERSLPAHGDKPFHAFLSRIKMNPEQILRYNRCRSNNGAPLFLYPESDIPLQCRHCCGAMIFEMQILPTIINYLRLADNRKNHVDYLEFGSAFVYTCKDSCDKSEEECVVVQQEKI